jgi:prevent-host-death family protein
LHLMQTVGIRELKNRLGVYMDRVRKGERIRVTDRGKPVAELAPIGRPVGDEEALAELDRRGELTLGRRLSKRQRRQLYRSCPPASPTMSSGELLDQERGDS